VALLLKQTPSVDFSGYWQRHAQATPAAARASGWRREAYQRFCGCGLAKKKADFQPRQRSDRGAAILIKDVAADWTDAERLVRAPRSFAIPQPVL
jgi:hypothetical protein